MSKFALQIENVHKVYKSGTEAVKGLSFEVEKGEFFALLGPNGSGKSTLINMISGPTTKTSGLIKVGGLDIDKHRQATKMKLGVVPQEISFDSFFTVNEALQLQSGYYGVRNNQKRIDIILEKLELTDKKHSKTRALSGGMKRRLLIAKALVHDPEVLILDEPTAGVDVELRHNLWKYMRELNLAGLTILLTTHYLEEAENLCKRIAIINKGELVAYDSTKKLIQSMGNRKVLTLSFKEKITHIPKQLENLEPQKIGSNEISISFDADHIAQVLQKLAQLELNIADINLDSQDLEDVFVKLTYHANK
jgi:ABC-2 type transport system ATP-binding protein